MTCYSPLQTYAKIGGGITFKKSESNGSKLPVRCGGCLGCRLDHSREWAARCYHEAQMHTHNSFITLTYAPEHLPQFGSLELPHFQKFMKRLRKHYAPEKIRFFHAGEYGKKLDRPHYHALLFGLDFEDKAEWRTIRGNKYYRSETLERLWPYGFVSIGSVTYKSAAYCARYIMKKMGGEPAQSKYVAKTHVDYSTGEIAIRREYATMSRRPGIGKTWYEKYGWTDAHAHDAIVIDGRRQPVPKYYDRILARRDPDLFAQIAERRRSDSRSYDFEQLAVQENVKTAQVGKLKRTYEEDDFESVYNL
jgi:hypothetical protein